MDKRMIEFEHLINASEVSTNYLNLTDDFGNRYGDQIGPHRTILMVIDGEGRRSLMKRHYGNQLTQCAEWFKTNGIRPSSRILARFNPLEIEDGRKVLHLVPLSKGYSDAELPGTTESDDSEAPIDQSLPGPTEVPIALEKQIEDFLALNLHLIEPELKLFIDDNGREGRQYPTDVGIIDLLC